MDKIEINRLLSKAGLGRATEVRHLGQGGLNNSYYARVGANEYCVRVAKYDLKSELAREADALGRLPKGIAPKLIYFAGEHTEDGGLWIVETYIDGEIPQELTIPRLKSLGSKLAQVHGVPAPADDVIDKGEVTAPKTNLFEYLLWTCRYMFTATEIITNLPEARTQRLVQQAKVWLAEQQKAVALPAQQFLLHNDVSPGNMLARGDEMFLVDWELRGFGDPMQDFSSGFWDFELNEGKWRTALSPQQWTALFEGYRSAGGEVDEDRVRLWMVFNKIVIAIYLTFLLHKKRHDTTDELQAQYRKDLDNVIASLEQQF